MIKHNKLKYLIVLSYLSPAYAFSAVSCIDYLKRIEDSSVLKSPIVVELSERELFVANQMKAWNSFLKLLEQNKVHNTLTTNFSNFGDRIYNQTASLLVNGRISYLEGNSAIKKIDQFQNTQRILNISDKIREDIRNGKLIDENYLLSVLDPLIHNLILEINTSKAWAQIVDLHYENLLGDGKPFVDKQTSDREQSTLHPIYRKSINEVVPHLISERLEYLVRANNLNNNYKRFNDQNQNAKWNLVHKLLSMRITQGLKINNKYLEENIDSLLLGIIEPYVNEVPQ